MNGFGTAQTRPLPPGYLGAGWLDGNPGENQVSRALAKLGVDVAFSDASPTDAVRQQLHVGPYTLDYAWPKLRIAMEADGSAHGITPRLRLDRKRDAWLRRHGWLTFRVDVGQQRAVTAQVGRVVSVVRALSRT
jgi:hypothetical protein